MHLPYAKLRTLSQPHFDSWAFNRSVMPTHREKKGSGSAAQTSDQRSLEKEINGRHEHCIQDTTSYDVMHFYFSWGWHGTLLVGFPSPHHSGVEYIDFCI